MTGRIVCWFSCGAASAVATKLAIEENARGARLPLVVARCHVAEEHPDNDRFAAECEAWFGVPILLLRNERFAGSIYTVFERERYIVGPAGAPCTRALKKRVREAFQQAGDLQVFGYTSEEQHRVDNFIDANNNTRLWPVLIERGLTHADCLALVDRADIQLPAMYQLGYRNNNCIGCVKGGAGYWNKIRIDFPEAFLRMAALERKIGASIVRESGQRTYLDELSPSAGSYPKEPEVQCGIFCELAERDMRDGDRLAEAA
ncbi:hypothetical protein [Cupriavidus plantarum]|uniref:hypothetical protein n=1 Tax=Cupriavidus plantarum TaxID=942865 RepID=UPI000E25B11B|nr:hypothetical protein [Cupriavidus plantarum]REE92613.1 hypothetical protein C7418_3882 [Cupriavidus plantarum]